MYGKRYVPPGYLQFVANLLAETKRSSYTLMRIKPGEKILDVGCDPGTDTIPLAEWVGATGQLIGVDYDPAMVVYADQRAAQADLCERGTHRQADAGNLPFEEESFYACRSECLFQHLTNPERTLAEMVCVTREGGALFCILGG